MSTERHLCYLIDMKRCHAGVSALLAWYLMAPPASQAAKHIPDTAPVATWKIVGTFDTAAQCRTAWESHINEVHHTDQAALKIVESFMCVSSNDPRLKSK